MAQKQIVLVVQPDGSLNIEAVGFAGADCEKATAFLEKALGATGCRKRTPDYYRTREARRKLGVKA